MSPREPKTELKRFEDFPASLRREYFTAAALLRFFTLWENRVTTAYIHRLSKDVCTLEDILGSSRFKKCPFCNPIPAKAQVARTKRAAMSRCMSDWVLSEVRSGQYMAYYADIPSLNCVCKFIPKLIAPLLKLEYFDTSTFELSEAGCGKLKEVRDKWEHNIRMPILSLNNYDERSSGMETYYYCTTKQLKFLLNYQMRETIAVKSKELANILNSTINEAYKDITLDGIAINDVDFNGCIGLTTETIEDYHIAGRALEIIRSQVDERRLTHLILALKSSVEQNLVSSDYLDRISGLIQAKRTTD